MEHLMRLKLADESLLVYLANHYTTQGAYMMSIYMQQGHTTTDQGR